MTEDLLTVNHGSAAVDAIAVTRACFSVVARGHLVLVWNKSSVPGAIPSWTRSGPAH